MASIVKFWWGRKSKFKKTVYPQFYESCIFQHIWRETCTEWSRNNWSFKLLHLSQLTRILLDCLLTHRFHTALHCLIAICGTCRRAPELLWRTGSEVLKQIPGSHAQTVQFYKSMFTLCRLYREEMLLEFAFYLIKEKSDVTEAYELINSRFGQKPYSSNYLIARYLGLLEYILWKSKKVKLLSTTARHTSSLSFSYESTAIENQKRKVDFHGKRALAYFTAIPSNVGVLDIFILRHVELLLYYDRKEEAHEILKKYRDNNQENPNAHKYFYYFLKSTEANETELQSVLASLLQVDPTSELVSDFTTLTTDLTDVLPVLFNKLDHSACKDDTDTWKKLADALTTVHERCHPAELGSLKKCWDTRQDWWPPYHFCVSHVPPGKIEESSTVQSKADIAAVLLGQDNEYTMEVRRRFAAETLPEERSDSGFALNPQTVPRQKRKLKADDLTDVPVPKKLKKNIHDQGYC